MKTHVRAAGRVSAPRQRRGEPALLRAQTRRAAGRREREEYSAQSTAAPGWSLPRIASLTDHSPLAQEQRRSSRISSSPSQGHHGCSRDRRRDASTVSKAQYF